MARAVLFHQLGEPEVLKIETVDVPAPGRGEVRIAVKALGLNRAESMFRRGQYLEEPVFPSRLGYEAAGTIESVGPDVTGFAPGDAVSTIPAFSQHQYGVYGDLVLAPAAAVTKHPPDLSWTEAAATWMQFLTAYGALVDVGRLAPGEAVLIPAASSSVGIAAIQIANLLKAIPIALTRTADKQSELVRLGAQHVIVTQTQDLVAETMRITAGKGARMVFDPVAGPTVERLAAALAPGGMLIEYGNLSSEPTPLPLMELLGKLLTIRGFVLFEVTRNPNRLARGIEFVVAGLATRQLVPIVAKTFPFSEIVAATRYLESNKQIGKIVVTV